MPGTVKSLHAREDKLASSDHQLEVLNRGGSLDSTALLLPSFTIKMQMYGKDELKSGEVEILQVNVGKMCNQTCRHCHVDAGPDRKEIMTRETMQQCIDVARNFGIGTVDITGGAPELNPDFRWFVQELGKLDIKILVRCNLTVIVSNPAFLDLPEFYAEHGVVIISSLPHFSALRTDAQRGEGVFEKSIRALQMLNGIGYGKEGSGLELHLVYNPSGAFLPPSQESLKRDFKRKLKKEHNIDFDDLYVITNMPISRFLDYLLQSDNYETYMYKLHDAFNPAAVEGVMCRNTVSVGWDGGLYDCDFNQMLEIGAGQTASMHISTYDLNKMNFRKINVNQHCYGCTAGAGSSCGGEIV